MKRMLLVGLLVIAALVVAGCGTGQAVQTGAKESVTDVFLSAGQTKSGTELCSPQKCSITIVSEWSDTPAGYFSRLVTCNDKITVPQTVTAPPGWGPGSPAMRISAVCR